MAKLYELSKAFNEVISMVDDDTVSMEALEDTLQSIEGEIEDKAENCAKFVRNMEGDVKAIDAEIARLTKRKKTVNNKIEGIKNYVMEQMVYVGKDKITTPVFTISRAKNPAKLVIENEKLLPPLYMLTIPAKTVPDNETIKEALKLGAKIDGAKLEYGFNLRIK
jgi:hypothetical protein